MEIRGQRALITGASAGIGKASAEILAKNGVNLVLVARRFEKVKDLAAELQGTFGIHAEAYQLDVQKRDDVARFCTELVADGKPLDILVNNAGLARGADKLHEADIDDWEEMIDTNVKGLLYMVRGLVPHMIAGASAPWVINIGSTAGIYAYAGGGVYCGTKSAVGFISDGLRIDTVDTNLRVCNIRPGSTETEFSLVRFHGDSAKADNVYKGMEPLYARDIAEAVEFVVTRPANVQVSEMTVMASCQASTTVIHRK